jgi:hypothetical protein
MKQVEAMALEAGLDVRREGGVLMVGERGPTSARRD